ncbi:Guard cell S-type anion channel SLAC1 [Rhynchospora pubera]|uniref:Guard cell S-type anion channel SLAC1 n=2 Tax=Rhynchospora pubera TaxID=906938 RepID=A0AAV8H1X3_9POAL|nr:Guard cell S-type anion channel SLAC1 [Rhynchospora pubera]
MVAEHTSPNVTGHHSVDVQTVIPNDTNNQTKRNKRMNNNQMKLHGFSGGIEGGERRPLANKTFNRQVSLGTGVTVLGMDKGFKDTCNSNGDGSTSLHRSGTSLGRLRDGVGGGVPRKGDFSIFRTKSTLNKQNSLLPSRELDPHVSGLMQEDPVNKSVPAGRYFAALRGPELDEVRDSEDILLPKDEKWPFLLRFPIGCFGICLGLGSQAILWGAISSSPTLSFLHITPIMSLVLWVLALTVMIFVATTYSLKCMFYFEAIRREYFHPVRVNFFFAPWIACMFLAIGLPPAFAPARLHPAVWCAFVIPVFALELKIYGQWLSGGKRRLCKVANPSSHLSVVGNFVGAILAAKVGWLEVGRFMWAIGLAHYLCVFVTLYQRLPTNEALPKELHPVYSMFVATPSAASIAWKAVYGEFDAVARSFFFIALFLYISLVVRIEFFRGFRFSVAWWSYTFPMTTASLASIRYAEEAPCFFSKGLALGLSMTSSTMVALLFVSTLLHAFVWRSLFPNDLAIAITKDKNTSGGKQGKKSTKKTYDIKRWAKQAPFSLVSSITKSLSVDKDSDGHLTT